VEPYRIPYRVSGENGAVATTVLGPPPGPTLVTGRERAPASPVRPFWALSGSYGLNWAGPVRTRRCWSALAPMVHHSVSVGR